MATDTQEPAPGTREYFLQVTQLRRWGTIQDYVQLCRAQGSFTPAFDATALAQMARIHVRRRLKQVTNAYGWPVFGNIARVRDDGRSACSCRRSCSARRRIGRSSPITTAWSGIICSRHRPIATTPRRATACRGRSSARTTARWAVRVRPEQRRGAEADATGGAPPLCALLGAVARGHPPARPWSAPYPLTLTHAYRHGRVGSLAASVAPWEAQRRPGQVGRQGADIWVRLLPEPSSSCARWHPLMEPER